MLSRIADGSARVAPASFRWNAGVGMGNCALSGRSSCGGVVSSRTTGLEDEFRLLAPSGWKAVRRIGGASGQARALEVVRDDGTRGVWRILLRRSRADLDRFERELKILQEPKFHHPAIVELLAWTADPQRAPWYITRLGTRFATYWRRVRASCESRSHDLLRAATEVLLHLSEGLAPLHAAGVVHRDIKPANLVVPHKGNARPCLIDFGLAHEESAPRLTALDDAVGNASMSPDVMRNRMEVVTPWVDVFHLSQLFMWMVGETSAKQWTRPIHWRYAKYDPNAPASSVLACRALTACCSSEVLSPRNAGEFGSLVRALLLSQHAAPAKGGLDRTQIEEGRRLGESARLVQSVEHQERVETGMILIQATYAILKGELLALELDDESGFEIKIETHMEPDQWIPKVAVGVQSTTLLSIDVRDEQGRGFVIAIGLRYFGDRSDTPREAREAIASGTLPFVITLERGAPSGRSLYLTQERSGQLKLQWTNFKNSRNVSIPDVRKLLLDWMSEQVPWRMLYETE